MKKFGNLFILLFILLLFPLCLTTGCTKLSTGTGGSAEAHKYFSKSLDAAEYDKTDEAIKLVSKAIEADNKSRAVYQ